VLVGNEAPLLAHVERDKTLNNARIHEGKRPTLEDNSQCSTHNDKKENDLKTDSNDRAELSVECQQEECTGAGIEEESIIQLRSDDDDDTGVVSGRMSSYPSETSGAIHGKGKQTTISKEDIVLFLSGTFRQCNVQIGDHFPDIRAFIVTAKQMLQRNDFAELSEPQFQRLRKAVTKANKELQVEGF